MAFERERIGELARRMSALLLVDLSLDAVFDRLCDLLSSFVEATTVFVALRTPDGSFLEFRYDHGRIQHVVAQELPQQQEIDRAMRSELGFITEDPAAIYVPLAIGEETIGTLCVQSGAMNEYSADDLMLLESIAPYVAVAIRNRMLQDAVEHERFRAEHDVLTGLANRALFSDRLRQAVSRADRTGELVGVVYADLDGFKEINDKFGHAAGDELLKDVARRLERALRASDTVARLGGDEFAMILESLHDRNEIELVIAKVRAALQPALTLSSGAAVQPLMSIGYSTYPLDALDITRLVQRADELMYAEKRASGHARASAV